MFGGYSLGRVIVIGVANVGVAKVVSDLVTSNTIIPVSGTVMAGLKSKIGVLVIGSIVGEVVTRHVDGRIDQVVAAWQEQKKEIDAKVAEKIQQATEASPEQN